MAHVMHRDGRRSAMRLVCIRMQTEVTLCTSDCDNDERQREHERQAESLEALSVIQIADERH
jgi:hypothetical protein